MDVGGNLSAITDLQEILKNLKPTLFTEEYVFCTMVDFDFSQLKKLKSIGMFKEEEGFSIIVEKSIAVEHNLKFNGIFALITLSVKSSLKAVGLTALISNTLAKENISTNIVAAYHHDHVFIPTERAEEALKLIKNLSK